MTTLSKTNLSTLAIRINEKNQLAKASAETAVIYAIECGYALNEAKALVQHGEWQTWLADNCEVSERHAQRYMKLANRYPSIEEAKTTRVSDLSMREAMKELETPNVETKKDCPVTWGVSARVILGELKDNAKLMNRLSGELSEQDFILMANCAHLLAELFEVIESYDGSDQLAFKMCLEVLRQDTEWHRQNPDVANLYKWYVGNGIFRQMPQAMNLFH